MPDAAWPWPVADGSSELREILAASTGPPDPPIRAEIFGLQRFAQHGRSLGETHRAGRARPGAATFFPRLRSNVQTLRQAHRYIGQQAAAGFDVSPAAEWLLDNFHLIEAQLKEIHEGLPRRYFRALPVLLDEPLAGLPRVYGIAWAFVAHTDGAFDENLFIQFLRAYQETRELNLSEMWALPTTLRVVLVENLRRLAERLAAHKAARELANRCFDQIAVATVESLDAILGRLERRGLGPVFLAQMAQRFQDQRVRSGVGHSRHLHAWLQTTLPDPAALLAQQIADQTADNLSVSNAVTSLRGIGDAEWPDIVARCSTLMRLMLTSAVFSAEHTVTRDQTLHAIEKLARRSKRSELSVADTLLGLMRSAGDGPGAVAAHWIHGPGRPELARLLGLPVHAGVSWRSTLRRVALPLYLGALLAGTLGLIAALILADPVGRAGWAASGWVFLIALTAMLFPASEAVVAVINRLVSESIRPAHLSRLALSDGVLPAQRTLVVIPALLVDPISTAQLVHRLQLHYLANPEPQAQFALLTDWVDADAQERSDDASILADAVAGLNALNARHAPGAGGVRFLLLHRERRFSVSEQRWIGWERKRGKLEALVGAIAADAFAAFVDLGALSRVAPATRYLLTLDSDTQLPPGRLRELVSVAAHPGNTPRIDPIARRVISGYGILQPRVVTPLPSPRAFTLYHWLFAGNCGIDPYSAASSEVYQDVFGEGTFTGKGLLDVAAVHVVLGGRFPDGQVLSHDLLEGSLARCGAVTDVTLIEEAPFHADVAASRVHRWTRGDWQLLPFLLQPAAYPLRGINRWKMVDNLRRSLVAPASLLLIVLSLAGLTVSPWLTLALVMAAFSAGPLLGALAGCWPARGDLVLSHFFREARSDLLRAVCGGLWHVAQLPRQAMLATDAVMRALFRTFVSRRHLLQWTTASATQAAMATGFLSIMRRHWAQPLLAIVLFCALQVIGTPTPVLTTVLCLVWLASPVWTWWVSHERPARPDETLAPADRVYLEAVGRDTWRLFERCVGPADRHLPPDNLQTLPHDMVAHRTSPTNIGLYLLSAACAREFGWIGTLDLVSRLEATLGTLLTLQRHRGHFMNWYDTQTGEPLLPMYVSTVDSGNLSGHLLAVTQACRALARGPHDGRACLMAIATARQRLDALLRARPELLQAPAARAVLERVLDLPMPRDRSAIVAVYDLEQMLDQAEAEAGEWAASLGAGDASTLPACLDELCWLIGDYLATFRSAVRDVTATLHEAGSPGHAETVRRLHRLADALESVAWAPEFGFLYHSRRHLLHLGFRVAEQELDAGFYDLLASESRLTSLLAIAKGDVPVTHWMSLGRPFYVVGAQTGLRSWSGSMFEYLMPTLVLDEPYLSALGGAARVAVHEQIAFARSQGVPWGVSESAHAGRDHTLAYQYSPQGVPRLALRRTPPDELVVAPYATALASQVCPLHAKRNFDALEALAVRGRYGFIEALDYTAARQAGGDLFTPVATYMSHHHGMSLVALANVLLDEPARRWGMADSRIEAVSSLLHERAPKEVSRLHSPPLAPPRMAERRQGPGLVRDLVAGAAAVEPTHLLSNGRYNVSLRANGAGWSRRGAIGITRWRDDLLRDACGSFFFVRWNGQPEPVSITQHPAPDPAAQYHASFHADRVCFDAVWPERRAHTTVWVSPEDDIEFRQVELFNTGTKVLDIELMSAFEVTLSAPAADEGHPAFMNLFVRGSWDQTQRAVLFERTPRLPVEPAMRMAHFLADTDSQVVSERVQTDRRRWLGRNHDLSHPLASFDPLPEGSSATLADEHALDTGLDPVCALAIRLRIAPGGRAKLTFATAASDNGATLHAMIDKYRQRSHVERASLMSATLSGIRLHVLRIAAANLNAIQTLTTALVGTLANPAHPAPDPAVDHSASGPAPDDWCDRRLLWRFGISGDGPIILVSIGAMHGLGLVRSLEQALRMWSWGGVACDLVVVSTEPASYEMPLQRALVALRDRNAADSRMEGAPVVTAFHALRADELSADELGVLRSQARVHFDGDGRPLAHQVHDWVARHENDCAVRRRTDAIAVAVAAVNRSSVAVPNGKFVPGLGEFEFDVSAAVRPARPWINVLSNPGFGAQLSESGGGYTWAGNSRLNQLTAWSNDPVGDPPSEWFLLQDLRTGKAWSVAPSAWGDEQVTYRVSHGQGYTVIRHRRGDLEVLACWCVDAHASIKQVSVRLLNHGRSPMPVRLIGIAEWMLGASRSDRSTVRTGRHQQAVTMPSAEVNVLLATQRERSAGFGNGTAFLALSTATDDRRTDRASGVEVGTVDWTCDRRECFDTRGRLVLPARLGERCGAGLDPCAALSTRFLLESGMPIEHMFLLGHADGPEAAIRLAVRESPVLAGARIDETRNQWDQLLGAVVVETPDPLFDAMVNRWLLYQSIGCRMWAKAGFYQAGGATGFRDQLQDAMALTWAAPAMLRAQIVLCASRQFVEGDVQHWWHAPTGAGVRTRFSDDLLWLPFACAHYLRSSTDTTLLDEQVPFLEGAAIPEGAEDAYYVPTVSTATASVYEHAARSIDRSLAVGAHGLPLMGTGDWNDGMNRVGHEGRGESVWLGWFLCRLVADFAPIARARGEHARALQWESSAQGWQQALDGPAWDGQWYRRAFFDDGSVLGSGANPEARIDLIAQAWSVLSGVADPHKQRMAMAAVQARLVDPEAGLIRLLTPPLMQADPSAGYIQAYPAGVRENGGQYSHAGVWALMAQARQFTDNPGTGDDGGAADAAPGNDTAWRYFTWLSAAHRSADPVQGSAYLLEPYVIAGDVYSQAPYVGRGGWSWYTGAAAWLHRAAIESIFGLHQEAQTLWFEPCLPSHWSQATVVLRRDGQTMRFVLQRGSAAGALAACAVDGARLLHLGERLAWPALEPVSCFVIPLAASMPAARARARA